MANQETRCHFLLVSTASFPFARCFAKPSSVPILQFRPSPGKKIRRNAKVYLAESDDETSQFSKTAANRPSNMPMTPCRKHERTSGSEPKLVISFSCLCPQCGEGERGGEGRGGSLLQRESQKRNKRKKHAHAHTLNNRRG